MPEPTTSPESLIPKTEPEYLPPEKLTPPKDMPEYLAPAVLPSDKFYYPPTTQPEYLPPADPPEKLITFAAAIALRTIVKEKSKNSLVFGFPVKKGLVALAFGLGRLLSEIPEAPNSIARAETVSPPPIINSVEERIQSLGEARAAVGLPQVIPEKPKEKKSDPY